MSFFKDRCLLARALKDFSKSGVGITSKFIEHVLYGATGKFPFLYHFYLLQSFADFVGQIRFLGFSGVTMRIGYYPYSYHILDKRTNGTRCRWTIYAQYYLCHILITKNRGALFFSWQLCVEIRPFMPFLNGNHRFAGYRGLPTTITFN